jgi:hypothetical protein
VIVTDYIILVTAVLSLAAAAIGTVRSFHNSRQIQEVHLVMNSRMTAALSRIEQLGEALQKSGVTIPPDPSLKGESS